VIRALHDNDVGLLGGSARQLDSRLDSLSSGVPEKYGVERRVWEDRNQFFEELDLGGTEANVDLRMGYL